MHTLLEVRTTRLFPCPICGDPLEVRESKKQKPYVVCDACGVQMFVRTETGIRKLKKLTREAEAQNIWGRLAEMAQRYQKTCSKCGNKFWVSEEVRHTDWLGELDGYRCPDCGATCK